MFYLFIYLLFARTVNINAKRSVLDASIYSVREMRRKIFIVYNMIVENLVEFIGHCSLHGKCCDDGTNGALSVFSCLRERADSMVCSNSLA